jgi:catechol 2,3-dioxygenase-like lactoylglutathione lyase family enzyme
MTKTRISCMPAFHISLNVRNLEASVDFCRHLFGVEPVCLEPGYAKFELENPPAVVALRPGAFSAGGPLRHFGLRLADSAPLPVIQQRLEKAGYRCRRDDNVLCNGSKACKVMAWGPDDMLWEVCALAPDGAQTPDSGCGSSQSD